MKKILTLLFTTILLLSCESSTRPEASFDYYADDLEVMFFNESLYADRYEWIFGDGERSTEVSPTHIYKEKRNYLVTLYAYNREGQCSRFQRRIYIK